MCVDGLQRVFGNALPVVVVGARYIFVRDELGEEVKTTRKRHDGRVSRKTAAVVIIIYIYMMLKAVSESLSRQELLSRIML